MTTVTEAPALWLGASWKMTKTLDEARAYVDELAGAEIPDGLRLFLLPAHTTLAAVRDRLGAASPVLLGAQNAYPGPEGAVTGEVSMRMVHDAGARLVELGHAERRSLFAESDELVAAKARAAVDAGLTPLVCVGETHEQRRRGEAESVVIGQVRAALRGLADSEADVFVAYEPLWAIGHAGRAADPEEIRPVVEAVRAELATLLPSSRSRVLYGGSVDATNVRALVTTLPVDGLFAGRAAWTAAGFADLARRCAAALVDRPADSQTRLRRKES